MAKFVLALICLTVIQTSLALKCTTCKDAACTTMENTICPGGTGNQEAICITYVYKNKDNKEMTEKKCGLHQKDAKKYECIPGPGETTVKCETCTTDLCNEKNGAPQVAFGALSVATAVFALLAHRIF